MRIGTQVKVVLTVGAIVLVAWPLSGARARGAGLPTTSITVNGNGGDRTYGGVGAVLGGGGNARYLADYPTGDQTSIMASLFKPGYGASLQLLKLEIGGDGNSTDGAEPSVEHTQGTINCNAGYEFGIAAQALALNPDLKLYGLQWGAPAWVGKNGSLFTSADITYLVDWLRCAASHGLKISYLGGWNEDDDGTHASWFHSLRQALDAAGYGYVQIVAGDSIGSSQWQYTSSPDVAILGVHDNCGYPTGVAGAQTTCTATRAAVDSGKPLWASELGAMDAGAQTGCTIPCAPAMDRAFVREYIDARVTAALEWPALDSMPADVLPYENRGLITADQPWSGSYEVNAMTWAIAQITQFVWPPTQANPGGWKYIDSASGFLEGKRADGSYITLVRSSRDQWSTIIETTAATQTQQADFTVQGGNGIAGKTVHVWASNFNFNTDGPSQWFVHKANIKPVKGKFSLMLKPGYVYSLTTTTGQGKGAATSPPSAPLTLPYRNDLSSGPNGDDEPSMLASEDGAFELQPCQAPDGSTSCAEQTAVGEPVLWKNQASVARHPYALIGSDWSNYTLTADVMIPQAGSAGLIGRYDAASDAPSHGTYNAYVFDVNTDGTYSLSLYLGGRASDTTSGQRLVKRGIRRALTSGAVSFAPGTWHTLALSLSGRTITATVDGVQVATLSDNTLSQGMPGIETGGWYPAYFSNLSVTGP